MKEKKKVKSSTANFGSGRNWIKRIGGRGRAGEEGREGEVRVRGEEGVEKK